MTDLVSTDMEYHKYQPLILCWDQKFNIDDFESSLGVMEKQASFSV